LRGRLRVLRLIWAMASHQDKHGNMKSKLLIRSLLLGAVLVGFSGCVTYPISKDLRAQAKPVTLAQASASPAACTGTIVIWGGQVIQTVNDTNGGAIYVLELPLTSDERPVQHGVSAGRFIARSDKYIDPEVFKPGRLITVAGQLAGTATEPLQKTQYTYPMLSIKQLHLWQSVRTVYYYPAGYWGWYGPRWHRGWYGPGWGWGWY
jgi:outer membrane lipoprotein